jgi:fused signal recognition particle receptor
LFEKLRTHINGFLEKISKSELKGKPLDKLLEEFKLILVENDVALPVADQICVMLKERVERLTIPRFSDPREPVKSILREVLLEILKSGGEANLLKIIEEKRLSKEPTTIVFVGINGTGKTTSIAKVAQLLLKNGFSIVLACSDTYRTGSIEQLEEHATRLGVKMIKHKYGADAAAVAFDAINYARSRGINVILIDTAGRMQTDRNLMEEMKKIVRVSNPDFVIFVGDALAGNDAVSQAEEFIKYIRVDGSILTKLDADAKGGSAISIAYITKKPILFFGVGQKYDDLIAFNPNLLVDKILH